MAGCSTHELSRPDLEWLTPDQELAISVPLLEGPPDVDTLHCAQRVASGGGAGRIKADLNSSIPATHCMACAVPWCWALQRIAWRVQSLGAAHCSALHGVCSPLVLGTATHCMACAVPWCWAAICAREDRRRQAANT